MKWTIATLFLLAVFLAACSTENLQGEAGKPVPVCGKPTHQYDTYNPDDRALEFVDVASGATISIAVDALGRGALVWKGLEYGVQVDGVTTQEPIILVDTNRDGWLDKRIQPDGFFVIPSCY